MSRWLEYGGAAESRRGEVASMLRGTEQKTSSLNDIPETTT
ncbi:hypothetical protein WRSd5_p00289 (plasmid) [Shigella dysenteriae WRSd5]|nr:hypothetical protein WRSd5_p00289 [Shigella dysenteriae WRSd5]